MIYQQDNHGEDYLIKSIPIGNDLRPFQGGSTPPQIIPDSPILSQGEIISI
jgi:hypothetical protein